MEDLVADRPQLVAPLEAALQAAAALPPDLPVLRAHLAPGPEMLALAGHRVLAFAGIGRPAKFFATLEQAGIVLAETASFADHHVFDRIGLELV